MVERNPASWMQAGSHPAEHDRLALKGLLDLLGAQSGVVSAPNLLVTANATPNMSVNVAAGTCFIQGTENPFQGYYHCVNDGARNVVIAASDPTNPRIDLVVARIRDASYSGAASNWTLEVLQGIAAASPAVPATTANTLVLAQVAVGAGASTVVAANITDRRVLVGRRPTARAYHSVAMSVPPSVWTAIPFDRETIDTHAMHDLVTNNSRFTIPAGFGGLYHVSGSIYFPANTTGERFVGIQKNRTTFFERIAGGRSRAGVDLVTVEDYVELAAGEFVEIFAFQSSGVTLNTSDAGAGYSLVGGLTRLSP